MITGEILWMVKEGRIPCLFHEFKGLYCPGCGGTRALKALILGHPLISFLYHPLILYCALTALWFSVSYLRFRRTKNPGYKIYLNNGYVYVGIGIILVNFIVKNYLLAVKGIDLLSLLPQI